MRGLPWLLGAGALIGAGGLVMTFGDAASTTAAKRDRIVFPSRQTQGAQARETTRQTLLPAAATEVEGNAPPPKLRDPLLVAIPPDASTALVFEAQAILHTKVGTALLDCQTEEHRERLARRMQKDGMDWMNAVDRLAVAHTGQGEMLLLQGKLAGYDPSTDLEGATKRAYGKSTTIFEGVGERHGHTAALALWHDSILIGSSRAEDVERAIDRLDGGGADAPLLVSENEAYGEIYGVVGRDEIERMAPEELRGRLHETASRATIHADADEDVLLVADLEGTDAKQVEDLGKAIGAAMAVSRLKAKSDDDEDLVRLIDASRVRPFGATALRAEIAMPTDLLTKHMAGCRK